MRIDTAALRHAFHTTGLPELWAWWLEQLRSALPAGLLQLLGLASPRIAFRPDANGGFNVRLAGLRESRDLGTLPPDADADSLARLLRQDAVPSRWGPALVLPPSMYLARTLTLPAATEQNLGGVLRYEMDRHTPFTVDQVYFDARVLHRDQREHKLKVLLVVARRSTIDELCDRLRLLGVVPLTVSPDSLADTGADAGAFNLRPANDRQPAANWRRRLAIGVPCALVVAALLVPLWLHRSMALDMQDRVRDLASEVRQLESLQSRRESLRDLLRAPERLGERELPATQVLAVLTRLLPDHTYLERLRIEGRTVRIEGESGAASGLIERLEGSGVLEDVRFLASVQRSSRGRERFTIGARVVAPGREENTE